MDNDPPPPYYEPSTQPGLEEEKHDVYYDTQNTMIKSAKAKRSTFATVLSMFMVIPYFGLLVCGLVSLGLFASKDNDIHKGTDYDDYGYGFCILYSTYKSDRFPKFQLSKGQSCKFFIYGQAFVSLLALVMIILSVIKIVWGRWLSYVLIFDFVVLVLGMILSMATSITVSVGLRVTCSAFKDSIDSHNPDCSQYHFVNNENDVYFQSVIHQSELAGWTGFGGVFLMFLIELGISLMACLIKRKKDTSSSYNTLNDPVAI